ncbi:LysR family transcriptional regulator [Microbacterium sp. M28]|uniref:LysR family transcriptional regulator n=1 Tax=Microbacterium sp. M28 TaxID=2962064 RepID=UPI0021F40672|nr:LysR family transcriptional regulator [Microbacterium sp. M28]UYO97511.1 LysR family transcriptional regulator [Microbacterium sp. M28]
MSDQNSDGLESLPLWRTFLAVHRSGSVSGAARMLGMAQPTVTAHLQALERIEGEMLFVRTARGMLPTARADLLATRIAEPFDRLVEAVGGGAPGRGPQSIRLGAAAEFTASVLLPALAPAIAEGLRVHMTTGLADDLLDAARGGRLDLVVSSVRPRGRSLPAVGLVDEEFVLVAGRDVGVGPEDVAARGTQSLSELPLLAYAQDVPILRRYWRHVFGARLDREPALVAPDLRALAAAAVAGAGVTVLPTYLIRSELADGRLRMLVATDDPPINTLFLVRRPGAPAEASRIVEDALRQGVVGWT